jgi:hypothetical protein
MTACRAKDERGKRYGEWLVIERWPIARGWPGVRWTVQCVACGFVRWMYGFTLRKKPPRCTCGARESMGIDPLHGRNAAQAQPAAKREL